MFFDLLIEGTSAASAPVATVATAGKTQGRSHTDESTWGRTDNSQQFTGLGLSGLYGAEEANNSSCAR